jgi:microcystin synthetase protein McyA
MANEIKIKINYNKIGLCKLIINNFGDSFNVIFSLPHTIEDGWSIATLVNEFVQAYIYNTPIEENINLQYGEFINNELLAIKDKSITIFWQEYLNNLNITRVKWKFDKARSENSLYITSFNLSDEQGKLAQEIAKNFKISVDCIFLLAYLETLSFFTNNNDITIGLVVNNRLEKEGGDKLLGLFLNTIPFRYRLDKRKKYSEDLLNIFDNKLKLQKYKKLPYGYIKSLFKYNLYEFAFNFAHFHVLKDNLKHINYFEEPSRTNIPFTLNVFQQENSVFSVNINVQDYYISEDFLSYFVAYYKECLIKIIKNSRDKLSLIQEDYKKIIITWNQTEKTYINKTIPTLFEEQVENFLDNIAVVYENTKLTYQELNEKANMLAHYLRSLGVGADVLVAIMVNRSPNMIIGLLGVLKAGGAYISLDPKDPEERLQHILEDAGVSIILTDSKAENSLPSTFAYVVNLDEEWEIINTFPSSNLPCITLPDNLVYVIYTSGTTGRSKGVMICHKSVVNYVCSMLGIISKETFFGATESNVTKKFAYCSTFAADLGNTSLYISLLTGSTLYLLKEEYALDSNLFNQYLKDHKITNIKIVPSHFEALMDNVISSERTNTLQIIFGGELLKKSFLIGLAKDSTLPENILNHYGPTETTIGCATYSINLCRLDSLDIPSVPIGHPISNTQIYILDQSMNPVPILVPGEIYIGGAGLARGYLNRPDLTAEKFVPNPFIEVNINNWKKEGDISGDSKDYISPHSVRLYRTGDLARFLPDGNIEFLGRTDDQVKIRGFRIELDEIGSILSQSNLVKQAVVLAKEDIPSRKRLVGYVVPKERSTKNFTEKSKQELIMSLRELITRSLPDYMQLSQIVVLDEMPLTQNGKLNRDALPIPEERDRGSLYQAPEGLLEHKIALIWQELLKVEKISRNDNFFSLGGDSIISIQLVARAKRLGINFDVKQVFETPTIHGLAANSIGSVIESIPQNLMSGRVPLLPIQSAFFKRGLANKNHYNQSMWFIPKELLSEKSKSNLQQRLFDIYNHHDTLRLRYKKEDESIVQYYDDSNTFSWEEIKLNTWDNIGKYCTKIHESLDIINGPLSKIIWFESDRKQGLFWVIHHLLIDGVSWRILLDDLNSSTLARKTYSYQAFSEYVINKENLDKTVIYYKDKQVVPIVKDYDLKDNEAIIQSHMKVSLSKQDSQDFVQKAQYSYNTQANDLLLTALVLSVGKHTGKYSLWIDLEGHGREGNLDVSRTLGWFTIVYPVHLHITNPANLASCIKEVKEQLREVPEKGFGYGIATYQNKLPHIETNIVFNYLGQWDIGERSDSDFSFGYISKGQNSSKKNTPSHAISINGGIQQGILEFNFSYTQEFKKQSIQSIVKEFKSSLKILIKHCLNPNNYGYTPSDFSLVTLSCDDIESIIEDINV